MSETSDQPPPGYGRSSPTLESPATTAHTETSLDELFHDDPQKVNMEIHILKEIIVLICVLLRVRA